MAMSDWWSRDKPEEKEDYEHAIQKMNEEYREALNKRRHEEERARLASTPSLWYDNDTSVANGTAVTTTDGWYIWAGKDDIQKDTIGDSYPLTRAGFQTSELTELRHAMDKAGVTIDQVIDGLRSLAEDEV